MNRRTLLTAAPAAALAGAVLPKLVHSEIMDMPFLHVVMDAPKVTFRGKQVVSGDVMVVTPGAGPWDDLHLLRDGRFAVVQVVRQDGQVGVNVCGSEEHFSVPKDRVNEVVAGRCVQRLRTRGGRWLD